MDTTVPAREGEEGRRKQRETQGTEGDTLGVGYIVWEGGSLGGGSAWGMRQPVGGTVWGLRSLQDGVGQHEDGAWGGLKAHTTKPTKRLDIVIL